jgi:hypothetical protein
VARHDPTYIRIRPHPGPRVQLTLLVQRWRSSSPRGEHEEMAM